MAERDDKPATLAGLWLKSKPSHPRPALTGEGQMGLIFTETPPPARILAKKTAVVAKAASPPSRRVYTVRALVADVRQHVESGFEDIWVEGEISNFRPAPSGHLYFTLKDGDAQLPVVLFRRQAQLLRFRPQDGLGVLARGRISVYESRGQLQLIAETLEPRGLGALQFAFEQLRDKLKAEGLFDSARKRALPAFPRCVGVITSTGGAVLHDIRNVIRRRHAPLHLLVYPALMQGAGCASTVAAGIRFFNAHPELVDLILIARGGGSLEDLAGFNDEILARAIAASSLPVVSAVGHETDFTIADFVADLRAPTPSAAAELITAAQHRVGERVALLDARVHRAVRYQMILARQRLTACSIPQIRSRLQSLIGRIDQRLDDLRHRLESSAGKRIRPPAARLAALSGRLERHSPTVRLLMARRRLDAAIETLQRVAASNIAARNMRLRHASARLEALSPLAVLKRGYALVYSQDGQLLRSAAEVVPGERIRARLAEGSIDAEVIAAVDAKLR